jgi:hypothetical protein
MVMGRSYNAMFTIPNESQYVWVVTVHRPEIRLSIGDSPYYKTWENSEVTMIYPNRCL